MPHAIAPPTLRRLSSADLPEISAAYDATLTALADPASFRLFGGAPRFFLDHFTRRGLSVGIFDGARLIAYGAITRPAFEDTDNYARDAGWSAKRAADVVTLSAAFVHPKARGQGLHRRLIDARLALIGADHTDVLARAAPGNRISRQNMLACGMALIWAGRQSEGSLRHVFWRKRGRPAVEAAWCKDTPATWVHQQDIAAQQALLGQGQVGMMSRGEEIGFAPAMKAVGAGAEEWSGRRESNPPHELGKLR